MEVVSVRNHTPIVAGHDVRWCPQRDLVAVTTATSDASATFVLRLSVHVHPVFVLKGPGVVLAVAWLNGGRLLAVARALSPTTPIAAVSLIDAESGTRVSGAALRPLSLSKHPLTHLFWATRSPRSHPVSTRTRALRDSALLASLPRLPILPVAPNAPAPNPLQHQQDTFDRLVGHLSHTHVLLALRRDSTLELSLWGLFSLGSTRLLVAGSGDYTVLQSAFTPSLDSLLVATLDASEGTLRILSVDTAFLDSHRAELSCIACAAIKLGGLVEEGLELALDAVQREVDSLMGVSMRQVEAVGEVFERQEETMTPLESFQLVLATGVAVPSLESYLCGHSLGERGLRKWKTSFQTGYTNIEKLVHTSIIPLLERLLVHLTELLGYAKMGEKYTDLGLTEPALLSCIDMILRFASELQNVLLALYRDLQTYNEFFSWLTFVIDGVSSLDRSDEMPTPQFDVAKILTAMETLFGEGKVTASSSIANAFFDKTHAGPLGCCKMAGTLRAGFARVFESVSGAFEKTVSVRHVEVLWKRAPGLETEAEKPLFSMVVVDELVYVALAENGKLDVMLRVYNAKDLKSPLDHRDVSLLPLLESVMEDVSSVHDVRICAVAFLESELVVAVYHDESNRSLLLHLDTVRLLNADAELSQLHVKSTLQVPERRVTHLWTNPSQGVVSFACADASFHVAVVS